ncbi:MAG: hypothetical protein R6U39_07705 [Candidatus Aegiribacteria sp.]
MNWRRNTGYPRGVRLLFWALPAFILSCGPPRITEEALLTQSQVYASRASFVWENLETFQLRGRARLEGSTLVARGPFVLWGDPDRVLVRGDFYGPDGKPVVSIRGDRSGVLVYLPQEEYASFTREGFHNGGGVIPTEDLIFLLRTGFPIHMESWQISDLAEFEDGRILWRFRAGSDDNTMNLAMDKGSLFPGECSWESGAFFITAASPHDEYRAWPWRWTTLIGDNSVELELTEINITSVPGEGIWNLFIPVPVDTLDEMPLWEPADTLMTR